MRPSIYITITVIIFAAGCSQGPTVAAPGTQATSNTLSSATFPTGTRVAVFAGGCFWCMEPPFDQLEGVLATTSGYTGGTVANPTYKQVTYDATGHFEAVQVAYDPTQIDYQDLLATFWHNVDPFDASGQFCDKGSSYRTAIFTGSDEERALADATLEKLKSDFGVPIATQILPLTAFYPAEDYHQDYYTENPIRYKYYRSRCGRDERLDTVWGDRAGSGPPL